MRDSIYYRVTGGAALEFCRAYRDGWKFTERLWNDYAKEKGGVGHVRLGERKFGGIIFPKQPEKEDGWKRHQRSCRDGTRFYVPIQRGTGNAAGKALQAEFDALPLGPDAEDICDVIGFPKKINAKVDGKDRAYGVLSLFTPVQIAWTDQNDNFFVVLPDVNATLRSITEKGGAVETPEWAIPDGLEVSSRKRYELAVAEAAVRAEENA